MSIYEKRDERDILQAASRSGLFPQNTASREKQLVAQRERLEKINAVGITQRRKKDAQERYNYILELERLKGVSNRRMPGLRTEMARMAQLEQMISRVNSAVPSSPATPS